MGGVVTIFGLLGGWLLVAGPVYQGVLELRDEDVEHTRLRDRQRDVPPEPRLSRWWWLLPPVRLVLQRRRGERLRRAYLQLLDPHDVQALFSYLSKATGWFYVSAGGLLIALKETWETVEHFHLHPVWFAVLVVLLLAVALANAVLRVNRTDAILVSVGARPLGS